MQNSACKIVIMMSMGFRGTQTWVHILALQLINCVILGQYLTSEGCCGTIKLKILLVLSAPTTSQFLSRH